MIGNNVEIIICDVSSFEIAMLYMKAFHKQEEIIVYWDEPTISIMKIIHCIQSLQKLENK